MDTTKRFCEMCLGLPDKYSCDCLKGDDLERYFKFTDGSRKPNNLTPRDIYNFSMALNKYYKVP